jgi:hypothetical protein
VTGATRGTPPNYGPTTHESRMRLCAAVEWRQGLPFLKKSCDQAWVKTAYQYEKEGAGITCENGRGFDNIGLMVKDLPLPSGYKITGQELDEFFSPPTLKEMIPKEASLIKAQPIVMDRQKAGMILFDQTLQRVDISVCVRNLHSITIFKDKMIFIQCMVGTPPNSPSALDERFKKMEPLFRLVANSFVLQSQY